jgi:tetratricopeptide (TPR) repeat protein
MTTERLDKLLKFYEASPEDAFIQFALAKEYEQLNEVEKAFEFYHKLVAENEKYVGSYYHFGKFQETQNDVAKAIEVYDKGIEIAKEVGDNHALAELMEARGSLG